MSNDLFNAALIKQYDIAVPRYTSYPTAPHFHHIPEQRYRRWAQVSNQGENPRPLSLYVHIPFCSRVCYYCACTKIVTANRRHAVPYLNNLIDEIAGQAKLFDRHRVVRQMHWGGGTPTFLDRSQMTRLMETLRGHFRFCGNAEGEFSIEIDPREVDPEDVAFLRGLGFNRLSLGVQDTDQRVQRAVNRIQPIQKTEAIIAAARQAGFNSISLDLIYGLPMQTPQSFQSTLDTILDLGPGRLAVFNYAHLPHRFKVQKQIKQSDLPTAAQKLELMRMTVETLTQAGYVFIGMDHFARSDDSLVQAQKNGMLHRNFQGYSTHAHCDLIGLGMSSIGHINGCYAQNHPQLNSYEERISAGRLAIARGFEPNADDRVRRAVITELICHFKLDIGSIEKSHGIDFAGYFHNELKMLAAMERDGLIDMDNSHIRVTTPGRLLVRNICSVFDAYFQQQHQNQFSKAI